MSSPSSPQAQPLPRHFLLAFGATVLATGVFAAWLGWRIGGDTSVLYFSDAGTVLTPLIASVACVRAGMRHEKWLRVFWWLLGAACGAWMLGEVIWTAYDLAGSGGPPIPSWADVGYLTFIPLAVGALLCHPGLHGSGVRKARTLIDGLAIARGAALPELDVRSRAALAEQRSDHARRRRDSRLSGRRRRHRLLRPARACDGWGRRIVWGCGACSPV